MGRSYWFECSRCGFRAVVTGGADRGRDFFVQTIACQDCKRLYDAVVKLRFPFEAKQLQSAGALARQSKGVNGAVPARPPTFLAAASRLPVPMKSFRWVTFSLQCPNSPAHRVRPWNTPGKCPKCSIQLERNVLPYRIWD